MPRKENQTPKILAVLKILQRHTDEQHQLSAPQIVAMLEEQGIPCQRKSIYPDIQTLQRLGYDIRLDHGRNGGYRMIGRKFDLAELKLLVDAVQSSRAISIPKSNRLIKKLEGLTSEYLAASLQHQVFVSGRVKTMHANTFDNIDVLCAAMQEGCAVQFGYRSGTGIKTHVVSPYHLAWESNAYYLIAYQDYDQTPGVRHYRVDRISAPTLLHDTPRAGTELFENFDLASYINRRFGMFDGPETVVTLRCDASLETAMKDRFGSDIILVEEEGGFFHFDTTIALSPQFYGWLLGFGGKATVLAPASVREDLRKLGQSLTETYAE